MRFSDNPERNTAIIWFAISAGSLVLAIILAVLTFTSQISYARFFPPLLLACLSFLGILLGFTRLWSARKVDALLDGDDLLLHWSYRYEDIVPYLDDEAKRWKKVRRIILFFCALMLAVGVMISLTKTGVDYVAIGEYAGLLILTTVVLYKGLPAMGYGTTGITEFYLGKSSALFGGRFHSWGLSGGSLQRVEFREGKPSILLLSYSPAARGGWQVVDLRIPVPPRREQEIKELLT